MKKIIKIALLSIAAMSIASCQKHEEVNPLDNARQYVRELYKGNQSKDGPESLANDLKRISEVTVDGAKFEVTWTVDSDKVSVKEVDGKVVISPDFKASEDYEFTLTANIKNAAGETTKQEFYYTVAKFEIPGWKSYTQYNLADLKMDTPYYYGFYQAARNSGAGEMLFFKGEMNTKYFATTTNPRDAAAVYIEKSADESGYHQYFYDATGAKKYLNITLVEGKTSVGFVDTPTVAAQWEETVGQFRYTLSDGNTYYLGTYSTYNTISASNVTYISGDAAVKVDVSQFPCHLMATGVASVYGTVATELSEDETYKVGLYQKNRGEFLWATGEMNTSYLATSADPMENADVKAEKVGDGWRVYFVGENGEKNYFEVYKKDDGKIAVQITQTPVNVATWYSELNQLRWTIGDETRYLGTYNTYNTISSSSITYIDDASRVKVGVSQFILQFYK